MSFQEIENGVRKRIVRIAHNHVNLVAKCVEINFPIGPSHCVETRIPHCAPRQLFQVPEDESYPIPREQGPRGQWNHTCDDLWVIGRSSPRLQQASPLGVSLHARLS